MNIVEARAVLLATPLPEDARLTSTASDPAVPRVEQHGDGWQASIYLVRKTGLPLYLPPSVARPHPQRFVATFVVGHDELSTCIRINHAVEVLRLYSKQKLRARASGLKSARSAKRKGTARNPPATGRPKGTPRAQERTGRNRDRKCRTCGTQHTWRQPHAPPRD